MNLNFKPVKFQMPEFVVVQNIFVMNVYIGETSKSIGRSPLIHQKVVANLYGKSYIYLLNAAVFWLQPAVMNVDVFSNIQPSKSIISCPILAIHV